MYQPMVNYSKNKSIAEKVEILDINKMAAVPIATNVMKTDQLDSLMQLTTVSNATSAVVGKTTYDRDVLQFSGLNTKESVEDNQLVDMANLSSNFMPYIGTRDPRKLVETFTGNPNGIFSNALELAKVDGTTFYYDGVSKGTVTDDLKCMVNMNGNIVIFPDCKYYDYIDDDWGYFSAPDLEYVTEWNNRLWGVAAGDSYIYACVQGDFTDWDSVTEGGGEMDSYFVDTGGNSEFTGITTYMNHVIAFKSDQYFEIYGNLPSNFQVIAGTKDGLVTNEALTEVDSRLYFLSNKGPMVYTGGVPVHIGAELPDDITTGTFGQDKNKLYFSAYDGVTYTLYVYDGRYGLWHKEDFTQIEQFCNHLGQLYGLTSAGALYKMGDTALADAGETITWYMETKAYYDQTFDKKEYHTLNILAKIDPTGYMDVKLEIDNGDEVSYGRYTSTEYLDQEIIIPINQKKCNRFKLILEGQGDFLLRHVQRQFSIGSKLPTGGAT